MSPAPALAPAEDLLLRARGCALCAQLLSPQGAGRARPLVGELREVLSRFDSPGAAATLQRLDALELPDGYLKPLLKGHVSPYEATYEPRPRTGGGTTFLLADVAGFYRAFGFAVSGERPDHIVPQVEFVALLYAKEGYARLSGQDDGGDTCRESRRAFLADHLGLWLLRLAQAITEQSPGSPLSPIVDALLLLTSGDTPARADSANHS